jgi:hypothetical protein
MSSGDATMAGASAAAAAAPAVVCSRGVPSSVLVYAAGRPAFHVPLRGMHTFADLRRALQEDHGMDMEKNVLVNETDASQCTRNSNARQGRQRKSHRAHSIVFHAVPCVQF